MAQGFTKGVPIDTDATLFNNSDLLVPSQKAIKSYVDGITTIENTNHVLIADDTTTNAVMYPIWAAGVSGNQLIFASSTKITFNPNLGILSIAGDGYIGKTLFIGDGLQLPPAISDNSPTFLQLGNKTG